MDGIATHIYWIEQYTYLIMINFRYISLDQTILFQVH